MTDAAIRRLAQKVPRSFTRRDLAVPADIRAELERAVAWVRDPQNAPGRGLTALFVGPSGSGKTMAAEILAVRLGLDLLRVDLASVVSKYVGETEKHLGELFDQASSCVLLFDEGDLLFGSRTEVGDTHDRHADLDIGFLLQRMEEHQGAAILAASQVADADDPFVRRFRMRIDFPTSSDPDRRP